MCCHVQTPVSVEVSCGWFALVGSRELVLKLDVGR